MPRTATVTPGKTSFVKEYLHDHPDATAKDVNQAWSDAGMQGTISHPVVSEVRRQLGMIGKPHTRSRKKSPAESLSSGRRKGRKPGNRIRAASTVAVEKRVQATTRTTALLDAEVEIDRLIFQVMSLGDLTEVETALRSARRALYQALSS